MIADYPLVEKTSTYLLYRSWSKNENLLESADRIAHSAAAYIDGRPRSEHARVLSHFRGDLVSQMLYECGEKQRYLGLDTFIRMSSGVPRHLVMISQEHVPLVRFRRKRTVHRSTDERDRPKKGGP